MFFEWDFVRTHGDSSVCVAACKSLRTKRVSSPEECAAVQRGNMAYGNGRAPRAR